MAPHKSFVGRPFITILGGKTLENLTGFYTKTFALSASPPLNGTIRVINKVYDRPGDTKTTIATIALPGSTLIELDHFPHNAVERPCSPDCLPPGMAMVSFFHDDLDALDVDYICAPTTRDEVPYNGARTATLKGSASELIELIEMK